VKLGAQGHDAEVLPPHGLLQQLLGHLFESCAHCFVLRPMSELVFFATVVGNAACDAFHQGLVVAHAASACHRSNPAFLACGALCNAARDAAGDCILRHYATSCRERLGCKYSEAFARGSAQQKARLRECASDVRRTLRHNCIIGGNVLLHCSKVVRICYGWQ
jgi:hypothetical protein